MTPHQFWHEDMRLLEAYQKAYYSNTSYVAWLNGYYSFVGHSISLGNAFAKKGSKPKEYPKWENPMDKFKEKNKYKNINVEDEFRKQQIEQNAWLFNR
jgi:hypothetical protein